MKKNNMKNSDKTYESPLVDVLVIEHMSSILYDDSKIESDHDGTYPGGAI